MSKKNTTLIGTKLAKEGVEFIYCGPLPECIDCRFKKTCHNSLELGTRYVINSVRSNKYPCKIHSEGVKIVEIAPVNEMTITIPSKNALEGLTLSHDNKLCENILCKNYIMCNPDGIPNKYKIVKIINKINCPRGKSLTSAIVKPVNNKANN